MQQYTLSQTSLTKSGGATITEEKITLWSADGGQNGSNTATAAGSTFLVDGLNGWGNGYAYTDSRARLHTLNSNWATTTKFAFEITAQVTTSGYTAYFALWDMTTNTQVTASQVSTSSTTFTVLRSGQFTLTPGHIYGVSGWGSGNTPANCDASLIPFG